MTLVQDYTCAPAHICAHYIDLAKGDPQLALDLLFVAGWAVAMPPACRQQPLVATALMKMTWTPLSSGRRAPGYFAHRAAVRCGYDLDAARLLLELLDKRGFPASPRLAEQWTGRGTGWDVRGTLREFDAPASEVRRALTASREHVTTAHRCLALWGYGRKAGHETSSCQETVARLSALSGAPERISRAALAYCRDDEVQSLALILEMNSVAGYPLSAEGEALKLAHLEAKAMEQARLADMEAADLERRMLGLHLISPRAGGLYTHHGIYTGNNEVIHYAGLADGLQAGPVTATSLEDFAAGHDVDIRFYDTADQDPARTVARARSRLGEDRYNLLTNNCEHFCTWCVTGREESAQVQRLGFSVAASIAARALLTGPSVPVFATALAFQLVARRYCR